MKSKFILSISLGGIWLAISSYFAVYWAEEVSYFLPSFYVWWVIIGIALLPGFMMSTMFFSNMMHLKVRKYPDVQEDITILMCAHNEEKSIVRSIQAIFNQQYAGHIRLIVIDNVSDDRTKEIVSKMQKRLCPDCSGQKHPPQDKPEQNRSLEYVYCHRKGKAFALSHGLKLVCTPFFLTVDADTCLEKHAVQKIMNHIISQRSACVAGNLFVQNARSSLIARMQNYDYLLSIAAVKRFQGSYRSTLVAQGAFSAYRTDAVRDAGGWKPVMGEDIVLTYQLLQKKLSSTYEPAAVGYTRVPETLRGLYNQRKRWAIGMLEGLSEVPPWRQGTGYTRYFVSMNVCVIYLDLAFLFGLIPGILLLPRLLLFRRMPHLNYRRNLPSALPEHVPVPEKTWNSIPEQFVRLHWILMLVPAYPEHRVPAGLFQQTTA